jgi:hypothetical protein
MTKAEYNSLNDGEKLNLAWFLWNKFVDLDSPHYNQEFHFAVYGSRRLFVCSINIAKRGTELFELDIIRNIKMKDVPATDELDFPIPTLHKVFERVRTVRVNRNIPKERFYWIDFEIAAGDIFNNKNSNGYGTCSRWGLGCNNDQFDWTCEIPMQYVAPIKPNLK